jgi:hypothetical protein
MAASASTRLIIRNQFFNYIRFTASRTHCSAVVRRFSKELNPRTQSEPYAWCAHSLLLYGTKHKSIKFMVDKGSSGGGSASQQATRSALRENSQQMKRIEIGSLEKGLCDVT